MDIEEFRQYCLNKKGTSESMPFGDDNLVLKVMDKMYALIMLDTTNKVALKCDPQYAIELREKYEGVEEAYHFNKKHWNQVFLDSDVGDRLIKELIDHSYAEVLKKLTRKQRLEYESLP